MKQIKMITNKQILQYKTDKKNIKIFKEKTDFLFENSFFCDKSYYNSLEHKKNKSKFNSSIKTDYLYDALVGMPHINVAEVKQYFSFCFSNNEKEAFKEGLEIISNHFCQKDFEFFLQEIVEDIIFKIKNKSELFNLDTCMNYFSADDILCFSKELNKYSCFDIDSLKELDFIIKLFIVDPDKQREAINTSLEKLLKKTDWFILEYFFQKQNNTVFVNNYKNTPYENWKIGHAQIREILLPISKKVFFNPLLMLEKQAENFTSKHGKEETKKIKVKYESYEESYYQPIIKNCIRFILDQDCSPGGFLEFFKNVGVKKSTNTRINSELGYGDRTRQDKVICIIELGLGRQSSLETVLENECPKNFYILNVVELMNLPIINNKYCFKSSEDIKEMTKKIQRLSLSGEQIEALSLKYENMFAPTSKIENCEIEQYKAMFSVVPNQRADTDRFVEEQKVYFDALYNFSNTVNWFGTNSTDETNKSYYYKRYVEKNELIKTIKEDSVNRRRECKKINDRF